MIILKKVSILKDFLAQQKAANKTIGFVPTMGALHSGHISLLTLSKNKTDVTVCSIFVNPTQFNDAKDFEKYPVTIAQDVLALEKNGCDVLFLPSVSEVYPNGTATTFKYDLGELENVLEGKYRPGHFQGVAQVVHRLLNIVEPDYLFLGQKDYQQVMVIKRLIQQNYLNINVVTADTFRETSGLAMSSRNLRLTADEKHKARGISAMLDYIRANYKCTEARQLEQHATEYLLANGFTKVDYVSIADAETLEPVSSTSNDNGVVALIAAFINDIRLIDNNIIAQ
jgi:pantoate--beta-alanine ligase